MKKVLFLVVAMMMSLAASAQFTVYEPVIVPQRSSSMPNISFPDPLEDALRYNAEQARAMEIVSSDIITADGFNLISETFSQLRVKVIRRRNGQVDLHCLGIKKNGSWSTCEKGIASLGDMYKKATKDSDKTTILELMEYGNYLLIVNPNTEVYLIK